MGDEFEMDRPAIVIGISDTHKRSRVERILAQFGCALRGFANGYQLVEFCAEAILGTDEHRRPRLIVADSVLPGVTGLSMLAGIRALGWQTPVILLARPQDRANIEAAAASGASAICFDPVDDRRLLAASATLLRETTRLGTRLPCLRANRTQLGGSGHRTELPTDEAFARWRRRHV